MWKIDKSSAFYWYVEDFYIAKLKQGKNTFNITYNCNNSNLIIHEWYNLTKDELADAIKELLDYFKNIKEAA